MAPSEAGLVRLEGVAGQARQDGFAGLARHFIPRKDLVKFNIQKFLEKYSVILLAGRSRSGRDS